MTRTGLSGSAYFFAPKPQCYAQGDQMGIAIAKKVLMAIAGRPNMAMGRQAAEQCDDANADDGDGAVPQGLLNSGGPVMPLSPVFVNSMTEKAAMRIRLCRRLQYGLVWFSLLCKLGIGLCA